MEKAMSLAKENNIIVNSNLKRRGIHSDWAVVIKEILIDMPKKMIVTAVSKFGEIKSIKIQLIGLWQKAVMEFAELEQTVSLAARWSFLIGKDLVHVAMAVGNCETWASRDQFRVLLFTLLVGTTAHDLGDLLERAGRKTCVINWSLETGNRICCAVVCFDSDEILESAFHMEPIFGGVKLSWARLDLVCCERCGKFGHSALKCDAKVASALKSSKFFIRPVNLDTCFQLAKLYAKKNVSISHSVAFGGKSWAQVVSVASVFHDFCAGSGSGSSSSGALSLGGAPSSLPMVNSLLSACLALLECFSPTSVLLVVVNSDLDFDMAPTSVSPGVSDLLLGLSSSKVLTSKVGGLESKLAALDISVDLILAKLDQLCAGLDSSVISSSQ
ncbi:hypothetical protein G9A89_022445 [Geosiphon pyriformis]|nr:hypothetical protein G9A89_022445 [Geosiphon pyriformis]